MAQEPQSSRNLKDLQPLNQQQRQIQQNLQHDDPDDEVSEEIVPLPYRKAYEMAESFAATRIGQFVMNRADSLLKIVEMTAKWSLPRAQQDDKLHRPLPWIPFLVLIISLRLARVWISITALMIGNAPVKAEDVVYFIQTRRRKLRYLRLQGVKQINENSSKKISAGYRQSNLMSQLKIILSRAFCSPGKQRPTESHKVYFVSNSQTTNTSSNQQAVKRPRADVDVDDDTDADANLSVHQMLERYANENVNADDDPDFVPEENEAAETSSASSESDSDDEVAESEQNSNGKMETTMPVPIIEIKKEINNEMETLPENGPTNGGEHRTTDVALKFATSRPNGHDFHNLQNPTTHKQTTLNATSAAAFSEALLTAIATLEASSEGAFSFDSTELSLTKHNFPNTDSSPTLSAVSSTSSIETFNVRNEIVNKDQEISTATTPTSSSKSDEKQLDDFATPSLTSISSSEDDFYSPIGSPPDFNALQQESLKTPSPDTSAPQNLEPKVAEENHCATLDANRRTKNQRQGADHSSKHSHGHNQGHGHGNGGSQHHQIYKGRFNRQQHFEK